MKNITLILLLFAVVLYAQEEKDPQGIELPDFVITGVQSVNMPELKKVKPEYVSTLSKEFFNPSFSPESFTLGKLSIPRDRNINLYNKKSERIGYLKLGAGINVLPMGKMHISKALGNVLLSADVWAADEKDYIDNADYNYSGGSVLSEFFVSNTSEYLPGTKVGLSASYHRDKYHYFGSLNPAKEVRTNYIQFNGELANTANRYLKFSANVLADLYSVEGQGSTNNDLKNNVIGTNGFVSFTFDDLFVYGKGEFLINSLSDVPAGDDGDTRTFLDGMAYYNYQNFIKVGAGVNFASNDNNTDFNLQFNAVIKPVENLAVMAEYKPSTEYFTLNDLAKENRFMNFAGGKNFVSTERTSSFNFAVDYEFEKYFEIIAGVKISKADNYHYFQDVNAQGVFDVLLEDEVDEQIIYGVFNFHPGPFGKFYANAEINTVKGADGKFLPHIPRYNVDIKYHYVLNYGITIEPSMVVVGNYYTTRDNYREVHSFVNLNFYCGYILFSDFTVGVDFRNLLGEKHEFLRGYEGKPMDIIASMEYRW